MKLMLQLFKTIMKKKESWLVIGFGCFPLLLFISNLIDSNFMKIHAEKGSLSFFEFFSAVEATQYQLTLPIIAIIYLVETVFHDEVVKGTMFIYKDINRRKLLNAKIGALLGVYIIYFILTFVTSLITYYFSLIHFSYTSGNFFPNDVSELNTSIMSVIGIFLIYIICLFVAVICSTKFNNGITMIIGILFDVTSQTAAFLTHFKYFFPNCYSGMVDHMGLSKSISISLIISVLYIIIIYAFENNLFKKLEY